MVFTIEHKTFMIESYFRNGVRENGEWIYSALPCLEEFRQQFPDIAVLEGDFYSALRRCVDVFRDTGSITHRDRAGRPRVRTQNTVDDVRQRLNEQPTTSLRTLSQETGLSLGTCHTIVKKDLMLFPYKILALHELLPADHNRRILYCQWFQQNLMNNDELLNLTFFSDEAWFTLSGYINSQNMRVWSAANPHTFRESPLHPLKVGVWIAVSRRRIIGPIFFHETVTAQRYRNIVREFINQLHEDELQQGYFQQDGATAHTAQETLNYLREFFDDRIISLRSNPEFPPRSPGLTILDYFIFPYLKNNVYKTPINNIEELQNRITEQCANITPQILINAFNSMKRRVNLCLQENGGHFEQLL